MLIRRPQTPTWEKPNPIVPDPSLSLLCPKRWLYQDSGAVGLGIVAALHKSIILNSPAKLIVSTAPVPITSPRPAGCREESCRHGHKSKRWKNKGLFSGSPPRSFKKEVLVSAFTEADFLSHCCSCRKQLHGKDVYMYLEKAFCSMECRYQQIVSDELQEKCGRSKTSGISCSPYSSGGLLFFTGAVAA